MRKVCICSIAIASIIVSSFSAYARTNMNEDGATNAPQVARRFEKDVAAAYGFYRSRKFPGMCKTLDKMSIVQAQRTSFGAYLRQKATASGLSIASVQERGIVAHRTLPTGTILERLWDYPGEEVYFVGPISMVTTAGTPLEFTLFSEWNTHGGIQSSGMLIAFSTVEQTPRQQDLEGNITAPATYSCYMGTYLSQVEIINKRYNTVVKSFNRDDLP